ncbi:MAG: PHP domain-containing protein [Candidatus Methanomethylicia archaeon]
MKSYLIDFHVHSKNSYDSLSSINALINWAKKKGLNGMAITDHNFFTGLLYESEDFIIIPGEEVTTEKGDIIGLFLKKPIRGKNFEEVVREIKKQNGLIVLPHPFRGHKNLEFIIPHVDGIEVYNAGLSEDFNKKAKILRKHKDKFFLGGSDAHFARDVGNCATRVYCKKLNMDEIKKALLKKRTKIIISSRSGYFKKLLSAFINVVKTRNLKELARMVKRIPYRLAGR